LIDINELADILICMIPRGKFMVFSEKTRKNGLFFDWRDIFFGNNCWVFLFLQADKSSQTTIINQNSDKYG